MELPPNKLYFPVNVKTFNTLVVKVIDSGNLIDFIEEEFIIGLQENKRVTMVSSSHRFSPKALLQSYKKHRMLKY